MSSRLYAVHRIVAAAALAQLLVWTVSGLSFALLPKEGVSGAAVPRAHEAPIPDERAARGGSGGGGPVLAPEEALRRAREGGVTAVTKLELRATPSGLFYLARGEGGPFRMDARTGAAAPVTAEEAEEAARRDQPGRPPVAAIELLAEKAGIEYRTKPLPAYRVELADELRTAVYVDAKTGDVTARRTSAFRLFDFMFSLHIMDYKDRSDHNNPLLIGAAALALVTVGSGAGLWALRIARRLRRRRA